MSDEPFYAPSRASASRRSRGPPSRSSSSTWERDHARWLCELRDHGAYGVEAQFWQNEEFRYSRRFDTRALAVQWAEEERKAIEKSGA